jgi:uncharacterized LabA/DUF88 family protein
MNLNSFKKHFIKEQLGINKDFGKIFSFIDFGNVNNWFKKDDQDWNNKLITENEKISIDIKKLKEFSDLFSERTRCYYGRDSKNKGSLAFDYVLKKVFGKHNFISKDLQRIKHYLDTEEKETIKLFETDKNGKDYVEIRKCNFDVELSVDVIKKINQYDTFCLFSGDADFVYLNNFLRKRGKKIILIKGGYITSKLKESANLVINAQNIKKHIAKIEQRPD